MALVILVIGVVGFSAYRVGSKNDESSSNYTQATTKPAKKEAVTPKNKTYEFEQTGVKIDVPENWQINIESRVDQTQDGKNDGYAGKIKASNGWGISFDASQGGIGGGPGCNYQGVEPDAAACPQYNVRTRDILKTGDILITYSSNDANKNGLLNNCTVVKSSDNQYNDHQYKTGDTFEGTGWTCFSVISVNKSIKNAAEQNKPTMMRISAVFPYGLDKQASIDYLQDKDFQAVLGALKTIRQ